MTSRWKEVGATSGARIYVMGIMLVSTAATSRYLGPEGRGVLVAAVAWVGSFATFGYLSMAQPLFHRVSGLETEHWLGETLGTLLTIVGCLTLLGWVVAGMAYAVTGGALFKTLGPVDLLIAFAALPFLLWQENGNSMMLAMGSLDLLNRIQIASGTISLALVFVSLRTFHWGIRGALCGVLSNQILTALFGLVYMARRAPALHTRWAVAKELISRGAKLHLSAVGSVLAGQATVLIITNFRSPQETAFYHLAGQMLIAAQIIPGAVSSVTYGAIATQGPDRAWGEQRDLLWKSLVLALMTTIAGYALAPYAIPLIAGVAFLPAVPLLRILLLTVFGGTCGVVMISQWVARGFFSSLAVYGLLMGLLGVAGTYYLVPRYGIYGAAWVAVAAGVIQLVVNGALAAWVERRWRQQVLRHAA